MVRSALCQQLYLQNLYVGTPLAGVRDVTLKLSDTRKGYPYNVARKSAY